nr:hypothetical protein [Tanacetum cinerariifolium]
MEDDKESEELKQCLEIIPDDGDDVTIDDTPLSFKSLTIVDYKIHKEGKKSYFHIFRADDNSQMYLTFSKMLKSFDREDLEVLWRLVKDRFEKIKPVDYMDNLLFHNLKTMFEHHVEDNVWKNQQGLAKLTLLVYKVTTASSKLMLLVQMLKLLKVKTAKRVSTVRERIKIEERIKEVSNFPHLVIKSMVIESLEHADLTKESSQPKSTYEATASLTKFELKKILIDKIDESQSYQTAAEHRECYNRLIKSYNPNKSLFSTYDKVYSLKKSQKDKDKDEDPSARSD